VAALNDTALRGPNGKPVRSVWQIEIVANIEGGVPVVTVHGRLGSAAAPACADTLARTVEGTERDLVLNLSGVDYISSPALRVIADTIGRLHASGRRLVLCHLDEAVRIGLELAGLMDRVTVAATLGEAVALVLAARDSPVPGGAER
jgi:anti-anti-sigma factor